MKKVLGLGYWVQGFRCVSKLAVNFFLKDGLNVNPSTFQLLQDSANFPMVLKPLYGLLSDSCYISGQHRIPYIALGGKLATTLNQYLVACLIWNIRIRFYFSFFYFCCLAFSIFLFLFYFFCILILLFFSNIFWNCIFGFQNRGICTLSPPGF